MLYFFFPPHDRKIRWVFAPAKSCFGPEPVSVSGEIHGNVLVMFVGCSCEAFMHWFTICFAVIGNEECG